MSQNQSLSSRLQSSWTENRVFTVPGNERTLQDIKERFRKVGEEPYREN